MTKAKKKTKGKYDWVKLKNEYLTTNISLRGLAEKHNIPFSTVNARSSREEWGKQKPEIQNKINAEVEQKTIKSVIDEKVEVNKRHIALFDRGLDIVEYLMQKYLEEIEQGTGKKATACNVDFLMSAITKAQKGQRLALNLDNEDDGEKEPEILIVKGIDVDKI